MRFRFYLIRNYALESTVYVSLIGKHFCNDTYRLTVDCDWRQLNALSTLWLLSTYVYYVYMMYSESYRLLHIALPPYSDQTGSGKPPWPPYGWLNWPSIYRPLFFIYLTSEPCCDIMFLDQKRVLPTHPVLGSLFTKCQGVLTKIDGSIRDTSVIQIRSTLTRRSRLWYKGDTWLKAD